MVELLQTLIRPAWQLLMLIPMPWRSAIVILLLTSIFSWLFLRAFPWLVTTISQLLLLVKLPQFIINAAQLLASILLFPEYLIVRYIRQRGFQPPLLIYIFDDIISGILSIIYQVNQLLEEILKKGITILAFALRIRWLVYRKLSLLAAVFLVFTWYVRPQIDENEFTTLIDRGVMSWYSLENWVINGELKSSANKKNSPKQFIQDYFSAINKQQYTVAWNSLSKEYKIKKSGSYRKFLDWWENKVERVDLHGVSLKSQSTKSATINVSMQYLMRNKQKLSKTEIIRYRLVWNAQNNRWLINDSNYLDK